MPLKSGSNVFGVVASCGCQTNWALLYVATQGLSTPAITSTTSTAVQTATTSTVTTITVQVVAVTPLIVVVPTRSDSTTSVTAQTSQIGGWQVALWAVVGVAAFSAACLFAEFVFK